MAERRKDRSFVPRPLLALEVALHNARTKERPSAFSSDGKAALNAERVIGASLVRILQNSMGWTTKGGRPPPGGR
jgi:hypothetical protein